MSAPDPTSNLETLLPSLTRLDPEIAAPTSVVLLLHGGKPTSTQRVDGRSASWRRMANLKRAIAPSLHQGGSAAWLLRYRERGWNRGAPVRDARWALDEIRAAHPDLPVVLLGHSMGARTAVHVADDPSVVGVVGLAPWWSITDDPVRTLAGKPIHAAHGRSDKITSFKMTRAYLESATAYASSTELHDMGWVGHYMLRRVDQWNEFALSRCQQVLSQES